MFLKSLIRLGVLSVVFLFASRAEAQTLRGRVLDASTGAPVAGTIVKVVDPAGEVGAGTLTNQEGAFTLNPPAGFQAIGLAVERIGYANERFELSRFDPAVPIELRVNFSPIELGGIVVTAESICRVQPGAGSTYKIWDAARKSLEVTALTQAGRILRYETETYHRDLSPSDYSVRRGNATTEWVAASVPYSSISIERATEEGWVDGSPATGMTLFAPDASVLMTEEFASQHCFTAEETSEGVLLEFTPNSERRTYPELEGTMVLDPATSELTKLRFNYIGVPDLNHGGHAGGEIDFFSAPNGLRVVRNWSIRAPAMSMVRSGVGVMAIQRLRVDYVREDGGRVLAIETRDGTVELPAAPLDLGPSEGGDADARAESPQVASIRAIGRSSGAELLLQNNASEPFHVTLVQLHDCTNTAVPCGEYPVDVVVAPGGTETLFRVRKNHAVDPFYFEWDYVGEGVPVVEAAASGVPSATLSASVDAATEEEFRRSSLLTEDDIPPERYLTALDWVRSQRPHWLTARPVYDVLYAPAAVRVFVDGVSYTPDPSDPTEDALERVLIEDVATIEFVSGPTATTRWGTGYQRGAIVITTVRGAR